MAIGNTTRAAATTSISDFANLTQAQFRDLMIQTYTQIDTNDTDLDKDITIAVGGGASAASPTGEVHGDLVGSVNGTVTAANNLTVNDGVITNAHVNTNAAIAHSKLANTTEANTVLGAATVGEVAGVKISNDFITDNTIQHGKLAGTSANTSAADGDYLVRSGTGLTFISPPDGYMDTDAVAAVQASNFAAVQSHSTTVPSTLSATVLMYSFHVTGGAVTIPVGMFEGQIVNITSSTSGMTITWTATAAANPSLGIPLATSARLASGIWRDDRWYFSETVV